jgi:predicted CXXCH cytochrome family protein
MTQLPERESVLGAFDGSEREFFGQTAVPFQRDGAYWMRIPRGASQREARVALCVGSNRYQQYFEQVGEGEGGELRRLPLLWHVGEARWMHMNGAFLEPDDTRFDAHAASWNDNCIFCHNTGVEPRMSPRERRFESRVADLGIACEACHGPGREHVEAMGSPWARLFGTDDDGLGAGIVNPESLSQAESLALCGQCHSQRLPDPLSRIGEFLDKGPSFRPGDVLAGHVTPITSETPSVAAAQPELFRQRFWADGTARLTAYEYLGITQSACVRGGELTCLSCHEMHGGDVHGQLEPRMRGDAACTQCHAEIAADISAHTHHAPDSSGSRCMECHMPRAVYGVLDIHRSHRIEIPDVKRDVEAGRPHACTSCHLSESALWAAQAMAAWWGERYEAPSFRPDGAPLELAESLASLHAGDAVQRAVAARHLGREDAAEPKRERYFAAAALAVALGDGYPGIRSLALRSLRRLDVELGLGVSAELAAFDTFADVERRRTAITTLLARLAARGPERWDPPRPGQLVDARFEVEFATLLGLLELQSNRVISIGE